MIIVCRYAILINTNYDGVDDDDIDDENDNNNNNNDNDNNNNDNDNNNNDSSSCHHVDNRRNCPKIIMFISSTICNYWVSSSIR